MIALQLVATNDNNGNPRRCFMIYSGEGELLAVLDEGYTGPQVVRQWADEQKVARPHDAGSIDVPVSQYRECMRLPQVWTR